ncbi:MAG: Ig-like domain-containing protein [Cytophagales bacterium]
MNDYDDDGDLLRAEKDSLSDVNHGTVQVFPSGRLLYTHDGSETTIDSVRYQVNRSIWL